MPPWRTDRTGAERHAGLAGLAASGDAATCADLTPRLTATNAEVRWMAVDAAARLGCLSREALERIAQTDPDAEVRALAQKKRQ